MMKIKNSEIENATLEAIYWWNRDENYYHSYFSKLDKIYQDKSILHFFTAKIFEVFLKKYSIRRNISAGYQNVDKFIDELFKYDFVNTVLKGNTEVIDSVSEKIKSNGKSTNRQTKSLLSKIAFLINPNDFSLYDTLAKNAIWHLNKNQNDLRKYQLENYSDFLNQINIIRVEIESDSLFKLSYNLLDKFDHTTSAYIFFNENPKAFEMRIIDKHLWLTQQNPHGRKLDNKEYLNFYHL